MTLVDSQKKFSLMQLWPSFDIYAERKVNDTGYWMDDPRRVINNTDAYPKMSKKNLYYKSYKGM